MSADKALLGSIFASFSAFCQALSRRHLATVAQACPIFPDFKSGRFYGLVQLTLTVFLIFTAFIVIQHSIKRADPFYDIPGPFLARWTPLWLAYQVRRGRKYLVVDALHKKYGKFVRVSPNHISIADKEALDVVYGQGTAAFDKPVFYDAFLGDKPSVFSTRDRQDHARRRRLVSQAFSYKALQECLPYIHDVGLIFIQKLDAICDTGDEVDALLWFNFLAFDVLSDLTFGKAIGMLAQGSDVVTTEAPDGSLCKEHAIVLVDEREHLAMLLGVVPPSYKTLLRFIPDPFFVNGLKSWNGLEDFGRRTVKDRLDFPRRRDDILGRLLAVHSPDGTALTAEQLDNLMAETVTLLIAGSDTTSSSTTAIVYYVMKHPRVYRKLVAALEERVDSDIPEFHQVKDIPYLDATIDEGLRYHGTAAIGLPRTVPEGGAMCCGRFFPEGTEMSVPFWTIQHDPTIWGDPEVFRPERWLETQDIRQYLLTFGKGPRACLGRNLAYMEMRLTLATVFLRYNIKVTSDVLATKEGFMHRPLDLMVKFSRRARGVVSS